MHLKRWVTSLVAVPLLAGLVYAAPPPGFAAFIAAIALVALYEYFYIVSGGRKTAIFKPIPLFGTALGMLIVAAVLFARPEAVILLACASLMGGALLSMPLFKYGSHVLETVARQVQAVVYIPLCLSTLVLLRAQPDGVAWVFFVLFVVFLGDVGAFYAGTYMGRHKLSPSISPGKTLEGAVGGLAANIVVGLVFRALFLPELSVLVTIVLVVAMGAAGQAGDLFESELKRAAKIKDSGSLLPGHGGLLDRIDALLFAAPVAFGFRIFLCSA